MIAEVHEHDFSLRVEVDGWRPAGVTGPVYDRFCASCGVKQSLRDALDEAAARGVPDLETTRPRRTDDGVLALPVGPLAPTPLDQIHVKLDVARFGRRYDRHRRRGTVDRAISLPMDPRVNDAMAAAAEEYVALALGIRFLGAARRPDDGTDGLLRGLTLNVKWTPLPEGRLLSPLYSLHHADIYVLVVGRDPALFRIAGWARREELMASRMDLGHGLTYALAQGRLRPFQKLLDMRLGR